METKSIISLQAAAQLRSLRAWVASADRNADTYLKHLAARERMLTAEALEAWRRMSGDELTEALNVERDILTDGEVGVYEKGGRYFFTICGTLHGHDISSDPSITSPERLKAHVASVKAAHRRGELVQGQFNSTELREALKLSKKEARKECDFLSGGYQILALDANGERTGTCNGEPVEFTERPTLGMIDSIFERHPQAVKIVIEAEGYFFGEGTVAERFEDRTPAEIWSQLSIFRASK